MILEAFDDPIKFDDLIKLLMTQWSDMNHLVVPGKP